MYNLALEKVAACGLDMIAGQPIAQ